MGGRIVGGTAIARLFGVGASFATSELALGRHSAERPAGSPDDLSPRHWFRAVVAEASCCLRVPSAKNLRSAVLASMRGATLQEVPERAPDLPAPDIPAPDLAAPDFPALPPWCEVARLPALPLPRELGHGENWQCGLAASLLQCSSAPTAPPSLLLGCSETELEGLLCAYPPLLRPLKSLQDQGGPRGEGGGLLDGPGLPPWR